MLPGATVVLSTVATTADVFINTTSGVTSSTGAALDPDGPTTLVNPIGGQAFDIYACAGTGTHIVGYVILPLS